MKKAIDRVFFASDELQLSRAMSELKALCPKALSFINDIGLDNVAMCRFRGSRNDAFTNNNSESYNHEIEIGRSLTPFQSASWILSHYTRRYNQSVESLQRMVAKNQQICSKPYIYLQQNIDMGRKLTVQQFTESGTGVISQRGIDYRVSLEDHSCTCLTWLHSMVPCAHVCTLMSKLGKNPLHYIHAFHTIRNAQFLYPSVVSTPVLSDMKPPADDFSNVTASNRKEEAHRCAEEEQTGAKPMVSIPSEKKPHLFRLWQKGHNKRNKTVCNLPDPIT